MNDELTEAVGDFLAHKRALGRKYLTEEATLRLLVDFAVEQGVAGLQELTTPLLETFVASRPRRRARSFNHLVGILGCFLDWAVIHGRLVASPLRRVHRRETDERLPFIFDPVGARQILDAAAVLADNPRGPGRGATHHAIFALCYGLGLRAGEACGLRIGDVDTGGQPIGPLIHSFFIDHLVTVKGLRPTSIRSYRDTIRLLLDFVARDKRAKITKLTVEDLTFERVVAFLRYLEDERHNHVRTRNQRLAVLHTLP